MQVYHYMFKHSLWSPIQTNHKTCLRLHQASERPTRQNWKNMEMAAEIFEEFNGRKQECHSESHKTKTSMLHVV